MKCETRTFCEHFFTLQLIVKYSSLYNIICPSRIMGCHACGRHVEKRHECFLVYYVFKKWTQKWHNQYALGPQGAFLYRRRVALDALSCFEVPRHEGDDTQKKNLNGRAKRATFFLCLKKKTENLSFYLYIFHLFVVDLCLAFPLRPIIFSHLLVALLSPFSNRLHYM